MVALSLSVLALAAGAYLLIKAKSEYLSGVYVLLAWLVIALSLGSVGTASYSLLKSKAKKDCKQTCERQKCEVEKSSSCHKQDNNNNTCGMNGCTMTGCHMEGDSCVLDKEKCESIIGKAACDSMVALRGKCIFSKEECKANICGKTSGKCSGEGKKECCKKH